ncbi:hypothetical protein OGAPHI_004440 [Ogataea philodendri]|uniref:Calcium-transporting ATPase 2 n=1 Tax=Ogataea philodendri TaxID=1378263 RepID=A0A9P8P719_9ASCO|nr:uncharacterized protein OGAPHI_004440 [Ogataea philodendri]KAH3666251.1 hypothetical protein OGAPHI_004440 [Ogataea philodendri]
MAISRRPTDLEAQANQKFSLEDLGALHDPKSLQKLSELGGIDALVSGLGTDEARGLSSDIQGQELQQRKKTYGINTLPQKPPKSFLKLCWEAMHDQILIMLTIAAIISLALGLYETFGQPTEYDEEGKAMPKVEWVEGVAIIVAILIVVLVGSLNDFNKERQFTKLNAKKDDRNIIVYRSGEKQFLPIGELLVGDLVYVETGEVVPADSVLVSGECECDESALTGETHAIRKIPARYALEHYEALGDASKDIGDKGVDDPMLISGAKLNSGQGKAIVTAVGTNSMHGKIMMSLRHEAEETPLQARLTGLADGIAKFGFLAAIILFIVLFIKFCVKLNGDYSGLTGAQKGTKFVNILITAITIIVVAVPEGLPLAVTLALAFATTRMMKDGNLVRVLKSCETMGGATAICSDKTGTLTENRMRVVRGFIGDQEFDDTNSDGTVTSLEVAGQVADRLKASVLDNVMLNSTAFESKKEEKAPVKEKSSWFKKSPPPVQQEVEEEFVGSKTECALLLLAKDKFKAIGDSSPLDLIREHSQSRIVQVIPFESSRKWGGLIVKTDSGYRFYIKGASELVFSRCSFRSKSDGTIVPITSTVKEQINSQITVLAEDALRTLCLAHCDYDGLSSWPPAELAKNDNRKEADPMRLFGDAVEILANDANAAAEKNNNLPKIVIGESENKQEGLVLDSLVGIQDPLRDGVKEAVQKCARAGVRVRMVTGDNILTARAIARNCNILNEEQYNDPSACMEGPVFRTLSDQERISLIPKLCVLARSSPEDKRILVDTLRHLREVVAVTGDGTNDAPALKLADVGFSMGIAGTEVAREASDIILTTDDFSSIVDAIKWGRTVSTSIRKFVQFQLTVNVTAVALTFISSVASSDDSSVLTAVQLLWVNLIMDTLAALALATDKPADDVLDQKPAGRHAPLISTSMWKMIMSQSAIQLIITFVIHFAGEQIFYPNGHVTDHDRTKLSSLTFNTFVWLQFFNLFLTRKLDEGDGITKVRDRITRSNLDFTQHFFSNWYFLAIAAIIAGFQVLIMFVGGAAFSISRQTGAMWGTAIICGLVSIPAGIMIRIVPDVWVEKIFPTKAFNKLVSLLSFRRKKHKEAAFEEVEQREVKTPDFHDENVLSVATFKNIFGRSRSSTSTETSDSSQMTESTLFSSNDSRYTAHSEDNLVRFLKNGSRSTSNWILSTSPWFTSADPFSFWIWSKIVSSSILSDEENVSRLTFAAGSLCVEPVGAKDNVLEAFCSFPSSIVLVSTTAWIISNMSSVAFIRSLTSLRSWKSLTRSSD